MIRRRQLLGLPPALLASTLWPSTVRAGDQGSPFSLGVAAGDPSATGLVLWTRLCHSLEGAFSRRDEPVQWCIARDRDCKDVVQTGTAVAAGDRAHCLHVFADGLRPDTQYYYRFEYEGLASGVGTARTLPVPGATVDHLRLAVASCQEYSSGYFSAYRDLVALRPTLVFHAGDYIYESPGGHVRPVPFSWPEATQLSHYRSLYALYRQDPDLQAAHAAAAWAVIWDDHEVVNDWGPDHYLPSPYNRVAPGMDEHRTRIGAARRAFLEHMPLRASASLYDGAERPLYRRLVIGDLAQFSLLDARSYRDAPVCNQSRSLSFSPCPERDVQARSMLGQEQERWLADHFAGEGCVWNCLGQATVMAAFDRSAEGEPLYETDSWDNYPQNRERLLAQIARSRESNALSIAGNIHAFYLGTLEQELEKETGSARITELVTTSITAGGGGDERYRSGQDNRARNPAMRFFDNRVRGYMLLDLRRDRVDGMLRGVSDLTVPTPGFDTLRSFSIAAGENRLSII